MWPQYVKDRIKSTYFYFGSSIAVTAASAAAAFRSPAIMNLVARNGFVVSPDFDYKRRFFNRKKFYEIFFLFSIFSIYCRALASV